MEKVLTKDESYAERRKLFKNIWETAMDMDEKEADNITKPKIIKTLRLDGMDHINIGKSKKQRIKNLRHVCNRLLDFCDRQDAEDVIYEQLASETIGNSAPKSNGPKTKKSKRRRRKIRKAKSYSPTVNQVPVILAASLLRDPQPLGKTPYSSSPNKVKRTTIVKKARQGDRHLLNLQTSPVGEPGDGTSIRKVKKKPSKKKSIKGQSRGYIKPGKSMLDHASSSGAAKYYKHKKTNNN